MNKGEFVKNVYVSKLKGLRWRGRPLGRWKDRIKEHMNARDQGKRRLVQVKREHLNREKWILFCSSHLHQGSSQGECGIRAKDR